MSEYRCHKCETIHTTENMVSYCAVCFDDLRAKLAEADEDRKSQVKRLITKAEAAESKLAEYEKRGFGGLADWKARAEAAESRLADAEKELGQCGMAFVKIANWARERETWGISLDHIEVEASIMARNLAAFDAGRSK